jgi:hypothetical protein
MFPIDRAIDSRRLLVIVCLSAERMDYRRLMDSCLVALLLPLIRRNDEQKLS